MKTGTAQIRKKEEKMTERMQVERQLNSIMEATLRMEHELTMLSSEPEEE